MYYKWIKYTIIAFAIPIGVYVFGYIKAEKVYTNEEGINVESVNKSIESCREKRRNNTSTFGSDCYITGIDLEKFKPWIGRFNVMTMGPKKVLEERRREQINYYGSISAVISLLIITLSAISLLTISAIKVTNSYEKCPYCAKYIKVEAKVCQHCGNELSEK